jgi:hypothetical protein
MSTTAQVRSAWKTNVFDHSTIQALTTKIYDYDVVETAGISTAHDAKLYEAQVYNFIQYRVTKTRRFDLTLKMLITFPVTVQYYKEVDLAGANYNGVEDAIETIFNRVRTGLSDTWAATVDYWRVTDAPPDIVILRVNDRPVWRGQYQFIGVKEISL